MEKLRATTLVENPLIEATSFTSRIFGVDREKRHIKFSFATKPELKRKPSTRTLPTVQLKFGLRLYLNQQSYSQQRSGQKARRGKLHLKNTFFCSSQDNRKILMVIR